MAKTESPTVSASALPSVMDLNFGAFLSSMCSSARSWNLLMLMINLHGDFRLALDDVKVRHEITVGVDEKAGAESLRRADLDDRLADLFDQILHVARRNGPGVGGIKLRRVDADEQVGSGGHRRHDLGDPGDFRDDAARHDQHGVADVHDDGIGLFGEDFSGDGVIALELEGVRARELQRAQEQGRQRKLFS